MTEYGFYFINEDEANLYTSFVLNTLGVLHPSASDIPGNAGNRRSLSLFPEVNSAVKSTIEKGDGDYSQSVEQQVLRMYKSTLLLRA